MSKPTVAILFPRPIQRQVLDESTIARLDAAFATRYMTSDDKPDPKECEDLIAGADGCMTGWSSPALDAGLLACAPNLKIVAHSAGSVKPFVTEELWERGIVVTSAASAIAVDVAHFTLALMIVGRKNVMELAPQAGQGSWYRTKAHRPPDDLRGCTVGLIGASHIGRLLCSLLKSFEVEILLYDPFIDRNGAAALGASKVELEELFRSSDVVSVHAPSVPATKHMVGETQFSLMKDGATFINTSRGSLVDETALVAELKRGRIWAFLDVTDPEPPPAGSPLYNCPNLTLTPHIAGSIGRARKQLGRRAAEELLRFFAGEPQISPVTKEMLERSA